ATRIATHTPNFVGSGLLNLPGALNANPGLSTQWLTPSTGLGSLEAARGSAHVQVNGSVVSGEVDILGDPWIPATEVAAEQSLTAWNGGVFNGATWSGATWSGATWSGATWSGATWSGATWSG